MSEQRVDGTIPSQWWLDIRRERDALQKQVEELRQVAHQIVGLSRTHPYGDDGTIREIAKNANAALAAASEPEAEQGDG